MAMITLIDPTGHTQFTSRATRSNDVEWRFPDTERRQSEVGVARHSVGDSNASVYESSFIQLRHPGGKVWDSMFVSLTRDGSMGLSISRWGKDHWVKGQMQVKAISERAWSDTVRDKIQKGDYGVDGFIGRETPIDIKFSFMKDIRADSEVPNLPQIAFNQAHAEDIRENGSEMAIGKMMGTAIGNIFPTAKFFEHAAWNGHNIPDAIATAVTPLSRQLQDIGSGFLSGLQVSMGKPSEVLVSVKEPEPQIDREEVYASAWGGFA